MALHGNLSFFDRNVDGDLTELLHASYALRFSSLAGYCARIWTSSKPQLWFPVRQAPRCVPGSAIMLLWLLCGRD